MSLLITLIACSAAPSADSALEDSTAPVTLDTATTDTATTDTDPATTDTDATETITATLGGLRWELPCQQVTAPTLCTTVGEVHTEAQLVGAADSTYQVTLHLRGVIEPKTYTGGTAAGEGWSQDSTPANDTANIYALTISDPPSTWFVNSGTTRASSELWAEAMDVTLLVPIRGGARVTLDAWSVDALQIRNVDESGAPIVIDGIEPAPDAYDGQFIQMDVVAVD